MKAADAGESDEKFSAVLRGLEQIGDHLDAHKYPGRAWTETPAPRRGPVLWKIAAAAAALAACIALAVHFWPANPAVTPQRHHQPQPVAVQQNSPLIPKIIILQDADSYSIIDLHGTVPVVCFATRNSPGFEFITPIFGMASPAPAATDNSHL